MQEMLNPFHLNEEVMKCFNVSSVESQSTSAWWNVGASLKTRITGSVPDLRMLTHLSFQMRFTPSVKSSEYS